MKHRISFVWILLLAATLLPRPAIAAFHLMEIEQVIGGVNGDLTAQAVQIRQRVGGNNFVGNQVKLMVRDATGANPVTLLNYSLPSPTNGAMCARILSTTPSFNSKTTPATVPDYTMAAIPPGYLAAGSLTFENAAGTIVYWRVSWGGYPAGLQTVDGTNFGGVATTSAPAFGAALPSGGPRALRFTPACGTTGTNTAAQYALTPGAAVFSNNSVTPTAFTVNLPPIPALPGASALLLPALLGLAVLVFAILRRRNA